MKKLSLITIGAMLGCVTVQAQVTTNWNGNAADGNLWATDGNWSLGAPGDGDIAQFPDALAASTINVATPGALDRLNFYVDDTLTIGGAGGLTFSPPSTTQIILSNTTNGILDITTPVTVNGGGFIGAIQTNNASDIIRINGNLVLNSPTRTQGPGTIEINGDVTGTGGLITNYGSSLVFNSGTKSNTEIVLQRSGGLTINGGTVTSNKFQINGDNTTGIAGTLELNAANAVVGTNLNFGPAKILTVDVNAVQPGFGFLALNGSALTLDLTDGNAIWFAESAAQNWGSGSITITGFAEDLVRFGVDNSGLTVDQLALIDSGAYTLSSSGFLTAVPEPSTYALIFGSLALALMLIRHQRRG